MKYLHISVLILTLTYVSCDNEASAKPIQSEELPIKNLGKFWQITDIHWDLQYNETGNPYDMCHYNATSKSKNLNETGHFGNYLCDSPYVLVKSAVHAMKLLEPHPNFILWTGDNAPHTSYSGFSVIFETIKNVTEEMMSLFDSKIPILPVLGNHDTSPRDDYPPTGENFYGRYLANGTWNKIIPEECHEDFYRGGYYKVEVQPKVDVLVVNTNLYYRNNEMGQGLRDPGGQYQWLRDHLQNAKDKGRKVFIAAHSPPGYWERRPVGSFLNDSYNDEYVDLLNEYGDQIIAQLYGHEHTDSFKLFGTSQDDIKSVGFLAPSVTPWKPYKIEGAVAINPSVRLYTFSLSSVTDYIQYHLNLTEANKSKLSGSCFLETGDGVECEELSKDLWKVYYTAASTYGVEAFDVDGMKEIFNKLRKNDSYFQGYYVRNSAGYDSSYCNDSCKRNHICAMTYLKTSTLLMCLNRSSIFNVLKSNLIIVLSLSALLAISVVAMIYVITRPRKNVIKQASSEFDWGKKNRAGYTPLNTEGD